MQKVIGYLSGVLLFSLLVSFLSPAKEKINWISLSELKASYSKDPKPILIDVYTSWCGWCREMDRKTYTNKKLADYINEHYYAVKYDAESKDAVEFNGVKYTFQPEYNMNGLALYLLHNEPGYPTTVFLSGMDAKPAPIPGYMTPPEIEAPIRFFGDGIYKTKNYREFMDSFKPGW